MASILLVRTKADDGAEGGSVSNLIDSIATVVGKGGGPRMYWRRPMKKAIFTRTICVPLLLAFSVVLCGAANLFCPMGVSAAQATPPTSNDHEHPLMSGGACLESLTSSIDHNGASDPAVLLQIDLLALMRPLEPAGSYEPLTERDLSRAAPLRFILLSTFRI